MEIKEPLQEKTQESSPQNNMHPQTIQDTLNSLRDLAKSQSCLGAGKKPPHFSPVLEQPLEEQAHRAGLCCTDPALPVEPKSLPLLLSGPQNCTRMNPAQSPNCSSLRRARQQNRKPRHHCLLNFLFLYIFFVLKRKKHNYHKLQRTKALLE